MNIETLAKKMRDRAIQIELEESAPVAKRKSRQLPKAEYKSVEDRIEELKKTYFHAGRWVGGSKDYTARVAHKRMLALDENR